MNIPNEFSNLRTRAEFDDWPFGRQRCRCVFWIETGKRGERCCRVTENKTRTGWNKAKKLTFAARMVIADGNDGKTYVLALGGYGGVYVHFSMRLPLAICSSRSSRSARMAARRASASSFFSLA